jgi:hypothetical protein
MLCDQHTGSHRSSGVRRVYSVLREQDDAFSYPLDVGNLTPHDLLDLLLCRSSFKDSDDGNDIQLYEAPKSCQHATVCSLRSSACQQEQKAD